MKWQFMKNLFLTIPADESLARIFKGGGVVLLAKAFVAYDAMLDALCASS
jgi:hypothetical protein